MVRIFRGGVLDERFEGSVVVIGPRPTTMTGLVRGDLFVRDNSVCDVTGMVSGNLLAERTGKAILHGLVTKPAAPAPPAAAPPAAPVPAPKPPASPEP